MKLLNSQRLKRKKESIKNEQYKNPPVFDLRTAIYPNEVTLNVVSP